MDAVSGHFKMTRRPVTFVYAMPQGLNDAPDQARRVAELVLGPP